MPTHPTDIIVEATWKLTRKPRSVGRARALLREQLSAWEVDSAVAETVELVVSELVTNCVQHAYVPPGREIGVRFARYGGLLRVEVADANNSLPNPHHAADDDEQGRGLAIVVALAHRWGCCPRRHGIGKSVWAELEISGRPIC